MNQIKRELDFNWTYNSGTKKQRTTTCLECFSNEIFYEIFDYLDASDVYQAFINLNIRFQNLLTHSSLPLKVNFNLKSKSILEQQCRHLIIPYQHRIVSLHLKHESVINEFFNYCNINSSFDRLESIILDGLSEHKLSSILFYLNSLPRLFSLTIQLQDDSYFYLSDIYRAILRLPCLKYNKLSLSDYDDYDVFITFSINEIFSTIEYLVIDFYCTIDEIISILYHTPRLRHLTCKRLIEKEETPPRKEVLVTLPNLTHVSFEDCEIEFSAFEVFIKKISSQLRVFRFKSSSSTTYLDGNRWKQLIKKHMPYLNDFHFDFESQNYRLDNMTPNSDFINQSTSTFWIERQWLFRLEDSTDKFMYSIHPYRKKWYNYHDYEQMITSSDRSIDRQDSTKNSIRSVQLTIENYNLHPLYIDIMKPCFDTVQFTYLNFHCTEISIDTLIEIIRLLPNLDSLKVWSLSVEQLLSLSAEDAEMLLLVSITNKITNVKLKEMKGMAQVSFLMSLCPRMQYLEVQCTTEKNFADVIGTISMNNVARVPYLNYLCLCISNANEQMIQNIDITLDLETLFHHEKPFRDYVVWRIQDKIFLKWKP